MLVVGQILEGYVIYPRFLGDRVELPAVWVIFALFAGGAAFGFLGVMLAVPVAATIGVLCRFWLRRFWQPALFGPAGATTVRVQLALPVPSGATPRRSCSGRPRTECVAPGHAHWPARGSRYGARRGAARRIRCTDGRPKAARGRQPAPRAARPICLARGIAIDDADGAGERALLHLLNAAAEAALPCSWRAALLPPAGRAAARPREPFAVGQRGRHRPGRGRHLSRWPDRSPSGRHAVRPPVLQQLPLRLLRARRRSGSGGPAGGAALACRRWA